MSATSIYPSLLGAPRHHRTAAAGRSTTSIRTRYRRQTAALMIATTVVGLWMALSAPAVSPVTPLTAPATAGAADPGSVPAIGGTGPTRRSDQLGDAGLRGRDAYGHHHR